MKLIRVPMKLKRDRGRKQTRKDEVLGELKGDKPRRVS